MPEKGKNSKKNAVSWILSEWKFTVPSTLWYLLAFGDSLISTILLQLTEEEQTILGKYYRCTEEIPQTAAALNITTQDVTDALTRVKTKTGLDVHDTEDNFKLNFVMIAKRVLEKEKRRR